MCANMEPSEHQSQQLSTNVLAEVAPTATVVREVAKMISKAEKAKVTPQAIIFWHTDDANAKAHACHVGSGP